MSNNSSGNLKTNSKGNNDKSTKQQFQKILIDPIGSLRFVSGINQQAEDISAIVADAGQGSEMEIQGETQTDSVLRAKRTLEKIWEENKKYFRNQSSVSSRTVAANLPTGAPNSHVPLIQHSSPGHANSSFAARKTILQSYLEDAEQDHSAFLRRMGFQRNKILFLLAEKYLRKHNIRGKNAFVTNLFNVLKSSETGETIDVFRVEGSNSKDKNTDIFRCCFAVQGSCDRTVTVQLSTFPKSDGAEATGADAGTVTSYQTFFEQVIDGNNRSLGPGPGPAQAGADSGSGADESLKLQAARKLERRIVERILQSGKENKDNGKQYGFKNLWRNQGE